MYLVLTSLLDEIQSNQDDKVFRTSMPRGSNPSYQNRYQSRNKTQSYGKSLNRNSPYPHSKECFLCFQAGHPASGHFLSECRFLPEKDRKLARLVVPNCTLIMKSIAIMRMGQCLLVISAAGKMLNLKYLS